MYVEVELKMATSKPEINSFCGTSKMSISKNMSSVLCPLLGSPVQEMDMLEWVQERAPKIIKKHLLYGERMWELGLFSLCLASGREDLVVILSMCINT